MRNQLLIFIFLLLFTNADAQPSSIDSSDEEQQLLELCYTYSTLFGYTIDTICNEKLFATVSEWLGAKYCYAGDSKNGIDCSGFVSVLYKKAYNITLDGSSGDMYKSVKLLKKSELHEGDIVFFKIKKKRVSHVGVYLGHNKFAHASLKAGVTIDDLNEPYYKKYFFRGGRVKS